MALRLAGEDVGIQEKIEALYYRPWLQDTGDLEPGTKTITATSEGETADYSASLTLSRPVDARILVTRIASRIKATLGSGTSGQLWCRVYVDVHDEAHRLFNINLQNGSENPSATHLTSGTIFNLIADGAAHTYYFYLFADSGQRDITELRLAVGVGVAGTTNLDCLKIKVAGLVFLHHEFLVEGTGSNYFLVVEGDWPQRGNWLWRGASGNFDTGGKLVLANGDVRFTGVGTVASDINYVRAIGAVLRSLV
jgi:hypothetical protein